MQRILYTKKFIVYEIIGACLSMKRAAYVHDDTDFHYFNRDLCRTYVMNFGCLL